MLCFAALAFGHIASKKYCNGMKVRTGQITQPMVRMIRACYAEDSGASRQTLLKLLGEGGQRILIKPERAKPIPRESNGDPSSIRRVSTHGLRGSHLIDQPFEPRTCSIRIAKGEKLVARGQRWSTRYQKVLNIIEFQHLHLSCFYALDYCIRSSMFEREAFTFRAFLISSALTYGYSPYSRKLGH